MCGIVGVINKWNGGFFKQQDDTFFEMLYADAVRGYDSTGVVGVEKDGTFHIAKEAVEATWVIPQIKGEKWYKDSMSGTSRDGKVWIGHNRKTTMGKTCDENAHPFVVNKEFAFVHNGTLYQHEKLAKTDVDSKALAIVFHEAFGKADYKTALEDTLGDVHGAYATAFFDQRHNKLRLLRNKERPLCIVETPNSFVFASEGMMAAWILSRNGYDQDKLKFHDVPVHTLVSFDLEKTEMEMEVLVPKKSTPPISFTKQVVGGKTNTSTTSAGPQTSKKEEVSKHQLKAFRRAWVGRSLKFWVDDYVEKSFPRTFDEGEVECLLMGENDQILIKHSVRAAINIQELGVTPEDLDSMPWTGFVDAVEYDKRSGYTIIRVCDAKPDKPSLSSKITNTYAESLISEYKAKGITLLKSVTPQGKLFLFDGKDCIYESSTTVH